MSATPYPLDHPLFRLADEQLVDPVTYSRHETRGGYAYDIDGLGAIVSAVAAALGSAGYATGEAKERIRQGLHAAEVRAEIERLRRDAENAGKRGAKIEANVGIFHGFAVERVQDYGPEGGRRDDYRITGPYCEPLTQALKVEGARFDGQTRAWRLPVSKHARLRRIIAQIPGWLRLQEDAEVGRAEEARAAVGTYGPLRIQIVEHVLRLSFEFDREINEIVKARGARFSRQHGAWWLKLSDTEAARAIIQDVGALMQRRAEAARERAEEVAQEAVVAAVARQLTREHAASMLDAVTDRTDGCFYSGLHSVTTTEAGFRLAFPYDPKANDYVRQIGGRFQAGAWHVPLSAAEGVIRFVQQVLAGTFPSEAAPELRRCWECGRMVTYAEVKRSGGTWYEGNPFEPGTCYCGC